MSNDQFEQRWLSGLPDKWIELRADFLCEPIRITVDPNRFGDDLVAHYSIPQVQETGGPAIEPASDIASLKIFISEPTLLVSKLNPQKSTICIAYPDPVRPTLASSEFVAICSNRFDQRYAFYLWSSEKVRDRLSALTQSATRSHQRVNPSDITKLPWKWPPIEVQQRIARFLDEKTARIDALIERKQALLERLAEKRQALITRAVTKGLNPDVPMKHSRVDWLGNIPSHWDCKRLRFVAREPLKYGLNAPADVDNPNWPRFVRITDVDEDGALKSETFKSQPPEVASEYLLEEQDILLARSGATVGKSFIYRRSWGIACFAGYLIRIRVKRECSAEFIYQALNSAAYWEWVSGHFIQSTIQNINAERYANYWVALPPTRAEQIRIASHVESACLLIESAVRKINRSITHLSEYRNALITAAVTGQLPELNG